MSKSEMIGRKNLKGNLDFPFVKSSYKLKAGVYEIGTILQLNTSSGELEPLIAVGEPHSILTDDYSNETESILAIVYLTGCFYSGDLVLPEGKTIEDFREKLREKSIFIIN